MPELARFALIALTLEAGRGTGLRLSTVHGIIAQSGGHISVSSVVDLGPTFQILLPRIPCPKHKTARTRLAPARGTETVLLVEDEVAVRAVARRMLLRQGYHVIEAQNGAEALAAADEYANRIHLVITDAVMPEMGGAEVVAELQKRRSGIRALFISGYTEDEMLRRDIVTGAVALLEKPFTSDALASAVREALDADVAVLEEALA